MLWHKAWWELRFRVLLAVSLCFYIVLLILWLGPGELQARNPGLGAEEVSVKIWRLFVIGFGGLVLPVCAKILAGAGINAQTAMGMSRGFHGSMSYLLSLPVSRARLMATRATAGAFFLVLLAVLSTLAFVQFAPSRGVQIPLETALVGLGGMLLVTGFFYTMAVLLTAIFDEFWSGTLGLILVGMLLGYSMAGPSWLNVIRFMEAPSLGPIAMYTGLSLAFLAAAYWVVENKEY